MTRQVSVSMLQERNPYTVLVEDYLARMQSGGMPRPEDLGVDSWVLRSGARTFGFKTVAEAQAFKAKWGIRI